MSKVGTADSATEVATACVRFKHLCSFVFICGFDSYPLFGQTQTHTLPRQPGRLHSSFLWLLRRTPAAPKVQPEGKPRCWWRTELRVFSSSVWVDRNRRSILAEINLFRQSSFLVLAHHQAHLGGMTRRQKKSDRLEFRLQAARTHGSASVSLAVVGKG